MQTKLVDALLAKTIIFASAFVQLHEKLQTHQTLFSGTLGLKGPKSIL